MAKLLVGILLMAASLATTLIKNCNCQFGGKTYSIRLQPELDVLDIETYLSNPRLIALQIKCVLYDGPCDAVGRWAKPRVKAGLLGECLLCTEKQKGLLNTWLDKLIEHHPDLYRAGVAKFITNSGIEIPKEEVENIAKNIEIGFAELNNGNSTVKKVNGTTASATAATGKVAVAVAVPPVPEKKSTN